MHRNLQQQKMHNISTTECLLRANFKVRTLLPNVFNVKRMMWRRPWPPVFILISLIPLFLLPPYLNKETHSHPLRNLKLADQTFLKVKRKHNTAREFIIKKKILNSNLLIMFQSILIKFTLGANFNFWCLKCLAFIMWKSSILHCQKQAEGFPEASGNTACANECHDPEGLIVGLLYFLED